MGAVSNAKIGDVEVQLSLGWCLGTLQIGDAIYTTDKRWWHHFAGPGQVLPGPDVLHRALAPYTKEQIIDMLAELVKNADV